VSFYVRVRAGWAAWTTLVGETVFGCVIVAFSIWMYLSRVHIGGWEETMQVVLSVGVSAIGLGLMGVAIYGWRIKAWHDHEIMRNHQRHDVAQGGGSPQAVQPSDKKETNE
jgi:hypothetical protein